MTPASKTKERVRGMLRSTAVPQPAQKEQEEQNTTTPIRASADPRADLQQIVQEMRSRVTALESAAKRAVTERNRHSILGMAKTVTSWADRLAALSGSLPTPEIVCLCGDIFTTHQAMYEHLSMVHDCSRSLPTTQAPQEKA